MATASSPSTSANASNSGTFVYHSLKTGERKVLDKDQLGYGACRRVNDFEKLNQIGEGTYGVVYKARDTRDGRIVALKRVRVDARDEGISESALREITLLRRLRHPNVVRLYEIVVGRDARSIFLLMEFCEIDLAALLDQMRVPFTVPQVKCIAQQLLKGLAYLHRHHVIHRDLKVSNLLLTSAGELRIADFGLARPFSTYTEKMTPRVVTLWYRSPELLLGAKRHTSAVDMWATGCILGELLIHRPLLPGKTDIDQLDRIVELLGTPSPKIWPDLERLPLMQSIRLRHQPYNNIKKAFVDASSATLELLLSLFVYAPERRATAEQCLRATFFKEHPTACSRSAMPIVGHSEEAGSSSSRKRRPPDNSPPPSDGTNSRSGKRKLQDAGVITLH